MKTINSDADLLLNTNENLCNEDKEGIRRTLIQLIDALDKELGSNLLSVVLHGSLCTGDFDLQSSDLDLLVITEAALTSTDFFVVSHLHNSLKRHHPKWANRLEISYITKDELYKLAPPIEPRIYLNGGITSQDTYGAEWYFEKHTLHNSGLSIYGEALSKEDLSVTKTKLRISAFQILMEWWKPIIERGMHHLSDEYVAYGVLSMCRIIMTIEAGKMGSKIEAAEYVLVNQPSQFSEAIENVMKHREHNGFNREMCIEFIKSTVHSYLKDYTL